MFKSLFIYEFEKFWAKKINIACFAIIPAIVFLSLRNALEANLAYGINSPAFSSNINFHITSCQEMLITAFNAIIIIFFILSFNEEYQSGCLRMAFIRPISIKKLYLAKTLVLIVNMLLMLLLQLSFSVIVAQIFLPKAIKTFLFFKEGVYGGTEVVLYTFKFYLLGFLNLVVLGTVTEIFSIRCKTITGAIIGSLMFLVANAILFGVIINLFPGVSYTEPAFIKWASLSLFFTEFKGLSYFAAGVSNFCLYSLIIMFIIFKTISYLSFTKKDYIE